MGHPGKHSKKGDKARTATTVHLTLMNKCESTEGDGEREKDGRFNYLANKSHDRYLTVAEGHSAQ